MLRAYCRRTTTLPRGKFMTWAHTTLSLRHPVGVQRWVVYTLHYPYITPWVFGDRDNNIDTTDILHISSAQLKEAKS